MPKTKNQRRREAEKRAAESTKRECGHNHNDNGARHCSKLFALKRAAAESEAVA
jgi:hypothetical protein